jgi:hypothetical protein
VTKNYAVRLKCPHGDADELLILRNRIETLEQVQSTAWHFECQVHGVQQEIPIEVREINGALSPKAQPTRIAAARMLKASRRSKRIPLRVPVLVYGRTKRVGAFQEETSTSIVNAHGGLVPLAAPVKIGESLLVVNMATQKEQECRVASIEPLEGPKKKVGLAFLRSAPNFWGLHFPPVPQGHGYIG